jgi:hypothetical protein
MARQSTQEAAGLLVYMPIIVRADGIGEWERKFCASMVSRNRTGAFVPSEKQTAVMRRIVRKFQGEVMDEPLIEAGNEGER